MWQRKLASTLWAARSRESGVRVLRGRPSSLFYMYRHEGLLRQWGAANLEDILSLPAPCQGIRSASALQAYEAALITAYDRRVTARGKYRFR